MRVKTCLCASVQVSEKVRRWEIMNIVELANRTLELMPSIMREIKEQNDKDMERWIFQKGF